MKGDPKTKNLTITLLLTLTLLLLLLPSALADAEQYITPGVTRDNTYQQSGNGQWLGRTALTYTTTGNYAAYTSPLVADLDSDGINEIVLTTNSTIEVRNFTTGTGMTLKDDYDYGSHNFGGITIISAPYLMDYDADSNIEIVYYNNTDVFVLNYTAGTLTLEQTAAFGDTLNISGSLTAANHYFSIKCAPALQTAAGKDTCAFVLSNRTGAATYDLTLASYNLDDNTVVLSVTGQSPSTWSLPPYHNIHLADGDTDNYLEAFFAIEDTANGNMRLMNCELSSACKIQQYDDRAAGTTYTDVIISVLDAANEVATWGYMISNNMYAKSVKLKNNVTMTDGYVSVLTAPEGDYYSENWIEADDTTYCDYSGDVYVYIRNYDQTDPGANIDTVFCVSQYAGAGYEETTVSNTNKNDTHSTFVMHQTDLYGSGITSLLLSQWALQGATKENLPSLNNDEVLIPVDASKSGSLDLIGCNTSRCVYYDDNYVNTNYNIISIEGTPSPLCYGYTYTFTATLEDAESDAGKGYVTEQYVNTTVIGNISNVSINPFVAAQTSYYYADATGQFVLSFNYKDQYHSAYDNEIYSFLVSNDSTLCNLPTLTEVTTYETTAAANETAEFEADVEELFDNIGLKSKKARNIIGIIIIFMTVVLVFMKTRAVEIALPVGFGASLICFFLGLLTVFPLVVILIISVLMIVWRLTSNGV